MRAVQKPVINGNGVTSIQAECHLVWMIAHRNVTRFYVSRAVSSGFRKVSVYRRTPVMSARQYSKCAVLFVCSSEIA